MAVFIVTYDLNKELRRPPIVAEVKKSPGWARLSESSYAISTAETPDQVFKRFKPLLDDNDDFFVITLKKPFQSWASKEINDWLTNHLA